MSLRVTLLMVFAGAAYSARVGESDLDSHEVDGWPFSSPDPDKERDKKLKADIAACAADPKKAVKNEVCELRVEGDGLTMYGGESPIDGSKGGFQKECCFKTWKCHPDPDASDNEFDGHAHFGETQVKMKTRTCRDQNFITRLAHQEAAARNQAAKEFIENRRKWQAQFPVGYTGFGVTHKRNENKYTAHERNQPEMQAAEEKNRMDRGFYKAVQEGGYMGSKPYKEGPTQEIGAHRPKILVNGKGFY
eukprot:TRINITY_DN49216_c0_g1_i2.p1 TRINITY_DN49216_c0_g1~~TRINITY_DN49216_c0_g1_i2.p1  ORF type:complete len:248 (+),score=29.84 TRINITY_DN49216_c0_g1_i2:183-926(+)